MVMAGGKGERLYPLTLDRSKPAVPFGAKYRIVDFVLSNFINSGIYSIYVLVQYKSQSLIEHIRTGWKRQGMLSKHFITVVPPQMRRDSVREWYRGTADSIYQNMNLIFDFSPSLVAVFGADHIYRMNIKDMISFHKRCKADVTVSCIRLPQTQACSFGVVETDKDLRIRGFLEKPEVAPSIPGNKDFSYISMGNYIFSPKVLVEALNEEALCSGSAHDFGKDVIPKLIKKRKVYAYDFTRNKLPGLKKYEEKGYWRDVGSIGSFFQAHKDLLGKKPAFDLSNRSWPIYASDFDYPASKIDNAQIVNSVISEGCHIDNARIVNSVIGRSVIVEDAVEIEDSVVMDFTTVRRGSKVKKAIIDRFNVIPAQQTIGYNLNSDKKRYSVDRSGIVVVKRGPRQVFYR